MSTTIEAVRSFWNAQPCDSTLDSGDIRYSIQPHIPLFAEFWEHKGKRVLEIGCGIGVDTASFLLWGAHVTAVDLSSESIKLAKETTSVMQLQATFVEANAEHLGLYLKSQPFDLIYSFGVIHHTPNPERVFEQLKYYCSPETELRIMLYAKWSLRSLYYLLKGKGKFWNLSEILRSTAETQFGCPVAYFYSFKQVRELMKDYEITNMQKAYIRGLPKRLGFLEKWLGGNILINARLKYVR